MISCLCSCFQPRQEEPKTISVKPKKPGLPEWTWGFAPEVIKTLGGENRVANIPIYAGLSVPMHPQQLSLSQHRAIKSRLEQDHQSIGVFQVDVKNENNVVEYKIYFIFMRIFDRLWEKAEYKFYGIYFEEPQCISFGHEVGYDELEFETQRPTFVLDIVKALLKGHSLGAYNSDAHYVSTRLDDVDPIIAGHEGRAYMPTSVPESSTPKSQAPS